MNASDKDGGYYAIKGFLYQFDKTIIDILDNPFTDILIEKEQDIAYDKYIIQVKHKETQRFANSKIRKPIIQLLDIYNNDKAKKLSLYCYFKDKASHEWIISSVAELDKILGKEKLKYTLQIKSDFINSFKVVFSDNFEVQFNKAIQKIKATFNLNELKDAIYYHSYFRSYLMGVSILPLESRKVNKESLKSHIYDVTNHVFYSKYSELLGRINFLKYIKSQYFTNGTNISAFERLIVVDCDNEISPTELIEIVQKLIKRYYKKGKSPAPYICFRNLARDRLITLKSDLIDMSIIFTDGTCFDGDKFRLDKLIEKDREWNLKCRIVDEEKINEVIQRGIFKQYFHFFLFDYLDINTDYKQIKVQIEHSKEILQVI